MARSSLLSPTGSSGSFRGRTLERLVDHVRALMPVGAVAFITVDERSQDIQRSAGWFADSLLLEAFAAPAGGALDDRRRMLLEAALGRDRPLLLPRVDAWEAAPDLLIVAVQSLGPARARSAWRAYRGASVIACPLRSEIGQALGVLLVASLDPERPLGRTEVQMLEVVADLATMALERARLLEDEAGRGQEELRLKRAGEAISASLELDAVYDGVVTHAAELTGASRVLLTRFNARAGELRRVAGVDFSGSPGNGRLDLGSGGFGHVARTRQAVFGQYDGGLMQRERIGSLMHAPIELGPRLYGVLSVAHEHPDRFTQRDLELLARLARSSAAAIANSIDFERERRTARALTLGFVPESLPAVPGYETGLLYAPALGEPTGGDVYGAWRLPGGDVAVLLGDVAGKGVEMAALSAMVRFFVEARSWDEACPATVLEETNAMLQGRLPSDTFVTVFLGVLSADGLRYCNAGHLPPFHLSPDGMSELNSHGLPLGIDAQSRYAEQRLDLRPGDLVFAYTDGLTEAHRGSETYGPERLAAAVQAAAQTLTPAELVRAVHEEIAEWADGLGDDMAALALRRSTAARSA